MNIKHGGGNYSIEVRLALYLPHLLVAVVSEVQLVRGGDFVATVVIIIRI